MNQKKKKKPKQDKKASLGYLEAVSLKMISSAPRLRDVTYQRQPAFPGGGSSFQINDSE